MRLFVTALVLDLLGAGAALLVTLRTWQTITVPRERPQPEVVVEVAGRTLDGSVLALGLVALAGVVAVLATRGAARRVVGAVLALAGAALVWRALLATSAVDAGRARALARAKLRAGDLGGLTPQVVVHHAWPLVCAVCGVAVLLAGAAITWRGAAWRSMSTRYERAPERSTDPQRAATAMWSALDRGDDPTER